MPWRREQAERAVGILAKAESSADERAEADLALGRALEPGERMRARALVQRAHGFYAKTPVWQRAGLEQAEAWLEQHPAPGR